MENGQNSKQVELVNFNTEAAALVEKDTTPFLKLKAGMHTITALEEPSKHSFVYEGETVNQISFLAEVKTAGATTQGLYTAKVASTPDSHYGQLMILGKARQGLMGKPFTLSVSGEGKMKRYAIVEASDLVAAHKAASKKV